jgi:hypothetical protein
MRIVLITFFLFLTSCKTADVNPTTSVLKYIVTNGNK